MEGHLTMSRKERNRALVLAGVRDGRLSLLEAAEQLGLCYRQARRVWKRFRERGEEGLLHLGRGRASNRKADEKFRSKVIARCRKRYCALEMGPTLMSEKLLEDGFDVCAETLRRWLMEEGLWKRKTKGPRHRTQRQRRSRFGELVQIDGSHHAWFGPERERACMMSMVDDATGETLVLMAQQETTEAAMLLLKAWVERYGVPLALYSDKKTVFFTDRDPTLEEQLAGEEPLTAFGLACKKLGIEMIRAHSAQAKGRVERKHGVFQDRFVKELALKRIKTIEAANRVLAGGFTEALNTRFAIAPADPADAHRALPIELDLNEVLCHEETRTLANDYTVRLDNIYYQVLEDNRPQPRPKERITLRRCLDGTLKLLYKEKPLQWKKLNAAELKTRLRQTPPAPPEPFTPIRLPKARKKNAWHQTNAIFFNEGD